MKKIIVYATMDKGDGFTEKIGEYESLDEIKIRVGMFDKDVIIDFAEDDVEE